MLIQPVQESMNANVSADSSNLLKAWENVKSEINEGQVLFSSFNMQSRDTYNDDVTSFSGKLYLWKSGYRIETKDNDMLVFNGLSTVIDHTQQQVIQSLYVAEDDDFAPAKLLQEDWLLAFEQKIDPNNQQIIWSTEDPFETFSVLSVEMNDLFPKTLKAKDQLQNAVNLQLLNPKWNNASDSTIFRLALPENYEIIDLRNE
jgi:hypothetical protein